jgi:hypothetical protein
MKAKARLTIGGGRDFDNGRVSLQHWNRKLAPPVLPLSQSWLHQRLTRISFCQFRFRQRYRDGDIPNYPLIFIIRYFLENR